MVDGKSVFQKLLDFELLNGVWLVHGGKPPFSVFYLLNRKKLRFFCKLIKLFEKEIVAVQKDAVLCYGYEVSTASLSFSPQVYPLFFASSSETRACSKASYPKKLLVERAASR